MQVKARYLCDLMERRHACLLVSPKRQAEPELLAAQPGRRDACAPGQADPAECPTSTVTDWLLKVIEVTLMRFRL